MEAQVAVLSGIWARFWAGQQGRLILWLPVSMGVGAAVYLSLDLEPSWLASLVPASVAGLVVVLAFRLRWSSYVLNFTWLILFLALGFAAAKVRTERVQAPVISAAHSQYRVTAFVIDNVSPSAGQPRLLLAPIAISGLAPLDTPLRLKVSLKAGAVEATGIEPGDAIVAFALLDPPSPPSMPGGYDPARSAYFQAIGGVGFLPGQVQRLDLTSRNWRLNGIMVVNRMRWRLTQSINRQIVPGFPGDPGLGGFAAALVTGQQAMVSQALIGSMRASGLAHILSISGVHMAVVGGFVFFALRGLLALIPAVALRMPVKKIAAAVSMVCIVLYLGLSGMPAPAVRAAVVACVAFAAILFDRRAISLRGLALAALMIIAATPEAVIQPGFQMSFAATAALLAVFELHQAQIRELSVPWWVGAIQKAIEGARLSLVISVVATLSTLPMAVAYFNRIALYGLVSNLFEAPITTVIVMPCLAVGTVLAGTPVGWICLRLAAVGLWLIEQIAALTAGLPHATVSWPSGPAYVLPVAIMGVIWTCLVRGRVRWAGVLAASTILWWPRVSPPDVWIDPQGGTAAVRADDEGAYALRGKVRRYGFEQWTQHYGLGALGDDARDRDYACRGYACIPKPGARFRVGFWFSRVPPKTERLTEICAASELIVLPSPIVAWPQACQGVRRVTAEDLQQSGSMELSRKSGRWVFRASQPLRGRRYWSSPSEADQDIQ